MRHFIQRISLLLMFIFSLPLLWAQEVGLPLVRYYSPKEYKNAPQVMAAWQNSDGMMYFGTGEGFLTYDGVRWKNVQTHKRGVVYSFAKDKKGKTYVATSGDFGYLDTTQDGKLQYKTLSNLLADSTVKIGMVWSVKITQNEVYFRANETIFQYLPASQQLNLFKADTNEVFKGDFIHQDHYFVQSLQKGLLKMENGKLQPAPHFDFFKQKNTFNHVVPFYKDAFLVPTRAEGLYLYNFNQDSLPKPFEIETADFFVENDVYSAYRLKENYIAFSSLKKGGLLINEKGKTLQQYNEKTGFVNDQIYTLGQDNSQNLWLGMSVGISKTEHSQDLSYWDKTIGLKNIVESVIRFKGTLYVATHEKVYFLDHKNQPQEVKNVPVGQNWELLDFKTEAGSKLLLAGVGIFEIEGNQAKPIYKGSGRSFTIYQSKKDVKRLYAIDEPYFISLYFDNNKWQIEGKWAGFKDNIRGIAEDKNGEIWLGTFRNGVIRISPDKNNITTPKQSKYYTLKEGFSSLKNILPFKFKDKIIFGTEKGLFIHNAQTDRFEPFCELGKQFCDGSRDVFSLIEMPDGKVWICPLENKNSDIGYLQPNQKGGYDWIFQPFRRFPEMFIVAFYLDGNAIWLGGNLGLFKYDATKDTKNYTQKLTTIINEVRIGRDSVIYYGTKSASTTMESVFDFQFNTVRFEFAAPFFDQEDKTLYAYQLDGFDENWSEWGRITEKEYTNLHEGTYTFKAKAKNVYGVESEICTYQITIFPPFYRTWWAYIAYLLCFIALFYALLTWNMKRLTLEKISLENIIKERTAEVMQQNENIKQLNAIGRELTASLNLEHILSTLYTHVNAIMDASVFGIGLYNVEKQIIDYRMAIENGIYYKPYTRDMKDKNQLPVWCIENQKEIFINDIEIEEQRFLQKKEIEEDIFLEDGSLADFPKSLIYIPMMVKEQVIGIITVQSFQKNSYTEQHLNYLQNIASYASIALENSMSYLQIAAQQKEIAEANDNINQANEELQQQQEELLMLNESLEKQTETIANTYKQLKFTSEQLEKSIEYASHIQEVIMPEERDLRAFFADLFILYKPKDVVSGDFYWFAQINEKTAIFALADCTGHGVPGAFMTMLGATLMHEMVNVKQIYTDPARMLKNMNAAVQKILKQIEGKNNDGMDISICFFEKIADEQVKIIFSGAKSRMYYVRENEIFELNGDKQFLGGKEPQPADFTNQALILPNSTQFYFFSDGFSDQNDSKRKKIGSKLFRETILDTAHLTFAEQKKSLNKLLFEHQGKEAQRDDIAVIGLKI